MTQEDKQLALKDFCARLPYHTIVNTGEEDLELVKVDILNKKVYLFSESILEFDISEIKSYLRPMLSMTEEEEKELAEVMVRSQDCSYQNNESATTMVNDWYLSKRFDVRGLIPKGLALEAPKDMYNEKR